MDKALLNRLRQQITFDLGNYLPKDCFKLELYLGFNGRELAWDEKWGIMAMTYGHRLFHKSNQQIISLTPRQYSAAKILYDLGNLASNGATKNPEESEMQAISDLCISLKEYIEYLSEQEAKPFIKLLHSVIEQHEKENNLENNSSFEFNLPKPRTDLPSISRSIPKQKVVPKFHGIYWDAKQWNKYLGDPPKWLKECCVSKGTKSKNNPSTWNPVQIAIALTDKGISLNKLDAVFVSLKDWQDEWIEKSDYLR